MNSGPNTKPLPQVVDLAEYREQVDRGDRTVVAMFCDGLGADPEPRLTVAETTYVGSELEYMRSAGMSAAKALDGHRESELHQRVLAVVAEVEAISMDLAERARGGAA